MLEDGARRPPSYYGLHCLALFAGDVSCYFLVGQGSPRPVLHDEKIYWGLEDVARRPPSYYGFLFCNNYAKCKDKAGYLKSRTGVSVPRPP